MLFADIRNVGRYSVVSGKQKILPTFAVSM